MYSIVRAWVVFMVFIKKVDNEVLGHPGSFSFWVMNWLSSLYLHPTKHTVALQLTVFVLFFSSSLGAPEPKLF